MKAFISFFPKIYNTFPKEFKKGAQNWPIYEICHWGHFGQLLMFLIPLHLTFVFLQVYRPFLACLEALKVLFPMMYNTWQKKLVKGTQN